MRERQPVGQLPRGLVGGLPVERHHGGGDTGGAKQLCAPAIAHGRHLYQVRAPANGLFEAMYGHVCDFRLGGEGAILRATRWRSSEAQREGASTPGGPAMRRSIYLKKNLRTQVVNSFCTRHPQLFHTCRI